jgi:hypothetical protein
VKRVLAVSYSQSGQLRDVLASILAPLRAAQDVEICEEILRPLPPFPFPWPLFEFFDVFPESVRLDPRPIAPLTLAPGEKFDLVVIAYQVWFLSPSQPIAAFLQSSSGKQVLDGAPVITVIGCRNMWLSAQETVKRLIAEAGGVLRDNIALTDRANALATFITTPRWLLTGRREAFLGLPPAGIASEAVAACSRFGRALALALQEDREKAAGPLLAGLGAATVEPLLMMSERAGHRAFRVWSGIIRLFGKAGQKRRRPALLLFALYLIVLIVTVVPLSLLLQRLLRPLFAGRLSRLKDYYEQPSGSQDCRLTRHV